MPRVLEARPTASTPAPASDAIRRREEISLDEIERILI
jgi:hypothetical protein